MEFLFPTLRKTIRAAEVVNFLGHLLRHLPGKLLVVWDRSQTHRGRLVREFVLRHGDRRDEKSERSNIGAAAEGTSEPERICR